MTAANAWRPIRATPGLAAAFAAAALCAGCTLFSPPPPPAPPPPPPPPVIPDGPVELPPIAGPAVIAPIESTGAAVAASKSHAAPYSKRYGARLAQAVRSNIIFPVTTRVPRTRHPCEVDVSTAPDGRIVGFSIVSSSGLREWDEAVRRALIRTRTLPMDVDGRVPPNLVLRFSPR